MKRYGIVGLLVFFLIFMGGISEIHRIYKKPKISKEEKAKEHLEDIYRGEAVLLSLKYKVDEGKVFNILVDENDIKYTKGAKEAKQFLDNYSKKARQRIEKYSIKYNIPTDIIASILIDYDSMWDDKSSD